MVPFTLLDKISDGSAADLYLAQRADQAQVFVELAREAVRDQPSIQRTFMLEAQARKNLTSACIARREQLGQCGDGRWFVMSEAIEGDSLRKVLATRGPLAPQEVARLLYSLCDALEYLHRRGLSHANLDPSLIILTQVGGQPAAKLLDTGLTLMRAPGLMPAAGVKLVRPEYLAPERVNGQRATPSSDIYGLGLLGYELLCGHPPFRGETEVKTRQLHVDAPVPSFPGSAGPLAEILRRCLLKDAEERWPTAEMLGEALREYLDGGGSSAPSEVEVSVELEPSRELVGRYELLRKIGEGAMGQVYLARHTRVCREVALKILRPELAQDRTLVRRFFQEAHAASRIQHQHIVEVFDLVEEPAQEGGRVYLVMELLHGSTLRDVAAREPMSISRMAHLSRQVADALAAAHREGIVHRDVKPENIFVTRRGEDHSYAKLLDFGVAKLMVSDGETVTRTALGTPLGTPSYMSPQQACGEPVDARTDIYSLGVVMFHLLTGKVPHDASTLGRLLVSIATQPPAPLPKQSSAGEPIPPALRSLVMRCLEKNPAQRPQSMDEVSAHLALLDYAGPQVVPAASERKRARPMGRALAVAAAVLLIGVGVWISRSLSPSPAVTPAPAPLSVTPTATPEVNIEPTLPEADEPPTVDPEPQLAVPTEEPVQVGSPAVEREPEVIASPEPQEKPESHHRLEVAAPPEVGAPQHSTSPVEPPAEVKPTKVTPAPPALNEGASPALLQAFSDAEAVDPVVPEPSEAAPQSEAADRIEGTAEPTQADAAAEATPVETDVTNAPGESALPLPAGLLPPDVPPSAP